MLSPNASTLDKLRHISKAIERSKGMDYFERACKALSCVIKCDYILIAELRLGVSMAQTLAVSYRGNAIDNFSYDLSNSPCLEVKDNTTCCYPKDVSGLFSGDPMLKEMEIEGYIGTPLYSSKGEIIGLLVGLSEKPITDDEEILLLFEMAQNHMSSELENYLQNRKLNLMSSIFRSSAEAMLITDADHKIIEVNHSFIENMGYQLEELEGKDPRALSSGLQDKSFYEAMWRDLEETGVWQGEITNRRRDGSFIEQWSCINRVCNENGVTEHYTAIYLDLSEIKAMQARNNYLLSHDSLTGLKSKNYLKKRLTEKHTFSLLLVRLRNLHYLNEAYGFEIGDEILKAVAKTLKKIAPADCHAIIGTGKYALLFNGVIDLNQVSEVISKHFANHMIKTKSVKLYVSLSFGGSTGKRDIILRASSALELARDKSNHVCVIVSENQILAGAEKHQRFIESNNLLHRALHQRGVIPYFQGIRDNTTGTIGKYEVLCRLKDGNQIYSPASFIEPARLSGTLPLITRAMIIGAFEKMRYHRYAFSINISEADLNENYLEQFLLKSCQDFDILPHRVTLEMLESISANEKNNHVHQLKQLKKSGFKLAIDDFGADYSNFERILELEIDYLKIDARYIRKVETDEKSREIVRSIAFFCKNSGIQSVAEFVETEQVQQILDEIGIDYSQGYLFARPEPDLPNQTEPAHAHKPGIKPR